MIDELKQKTYEQIECLIQWNTFNMDAEPEQVRKNLKTISEILLNQSSANRNEIIITCNSKCPCVYSSQTTYGGSSWCGPSYTTNG